MFFYNIKRILFPSGYKALSLTRLRDFEMYKTSLNKSFGTMLQLKSFVIPLIVHFFQLFDKSEK